MVAVPTAVKLLEENSELHCAVEDIDLPTVDMLDVPASNGHVYYS